MTSTRTANDRQRGPRAFVPDLPIELSPLFDWPPRPLTSLRYILGRGYLLSTLPIFLALAIVAYYYVLPPISAWATPRLDWIAGTYLFNLAVMIALAGGLHLYLYTWKRQGQHLKFDPRDLNRKSKVYFANNQVLDNMFWTLASGVTVWTAYQVGFMWALGNDLIAASSWSAGPVWFVLAFFLIPIWGSLHFYWIHRWLHWPPLYRLAHALHHRNANIGPWTGISMHPVEHLIYFSSVLIHLVVPSHPLHVLFHLYFFAISPMFSHSGYSHLAIGGRKTLAMGDFFHQLHHRYYECNYGTSAMPWDRWFGSFHDGTEAATARINERRRVVNPGA